MRSHVSHQSPACCAPGSTAYEKADRWRSTAGLKERLLPQPASRSRVSGWLVAAEVALSTLLLIATGLLFHTLWNLEHSKLGFDVTRVTSFTAMPADAAGFANMSVSKKNEPAPTSIATLFYQPTLERMRHVPGVQEAALISSPPLSGINMSTSFNLVGQPKDPGHAFDALISPG